VPESEAEITMQTQMSLKAMTDDELRAMIIAIQEELEEREWDAIVAQPQIMDWIVEKAKQARKEHLEGKTIEGGFGRE
jgi:hypothetical protein